MTLDHVGSYEGPRTLTPSRPFGSKPVIVSLSVLAVSAMLPTYPPQPTAARRHGSSLPPSMNRRLDLPAAKP